MNTVWLLKDIIDELNHCMTQLKILSRFNYWKVIPSLREWSAPPQPPPPLPPPNTSPLPLTSTYFLSLPYFTLSIRLYQGTAGGWTFRSAESHKVYQGGSMLFDHRLSLMHFIQDFLWMSYIGFTLFRCPNHLIFCLFICCTGGKLSMFLIFSLLIYWPAWLINVKTMQNQFWNKKIPINLYQWHLIVYE